MRPRDVLAQHLDLVETLGDGTTALGRYLDRLAQYDYQAERQDTGVGRFVARSVRHARAYLVTEQMMSVLDDRAHTMEGTDQIGVHHAPPRPAGFVVFEQPLAYTELRGREQLIHALTWGPAADQRGDYGWMVTTFNDLIRKPDTIAREAIGGVDAAVRILGRWHGIGSYWAPRGMRVGPAIHVPTAADHARVAEEGDSAHPVRNMSRVICGLWALFEETISTHTVDYCDRPTRRAAARRKLPAEVTVITLRRASAPVAHPGSGTPIGQRQWIEGFRRRYWVGTGAERRQEWRNVDGYWWPGNPELPIKDTPKVNRLAR